MSLIRRTAQTSLWAPNLAMRAPSNVFTFCQAAVAGGLEVVFDGPYICH